MRIRYIVAAALFAVTAVAVPGCGGGSPTQSGTKAKIETPGTSIDVKSKEGSGTRIEVKDKDGK